jgi:phosphatidate cytidylyltransferase
MLKTRVLTATFLLAMFLSALFFLPSAGWIAFCAAVLAAAGWEWGALAALVPSGRFLYAALTVALFVSPLALPGAPGSHGLYMPVWVYYAAGLFWILLVPLWMWQRLRLRGRWLMLAGGVLVLVAASGAMVELRGVRPSLLLAVLGTVWVSDTAAYFGGRRFGKRKLAPSISPGKTWEGVAAALAAVGLYALAWASLVAPDRSPARILLVLLGLAVAGMIGDLFESLIKRQAGVKDSGTLLPGHGGILDRIDAPVAMLPLAVLAFMR